MGSEMCIRDRYNWDTKDILFLSPGGRREGLLQFEQRASIRRKLTSEKWGEPTCIAVQTSSNYQRPSILVGTSKGSLLEFLIEDKGGNNQLRLIRQFLGHDARVTSLSISPSGKLLASASIDGTARIWRLDPALSLIHISEPTRPY